MTDQNKVSGKIINYNSSYIGDIYFSEKINDLKHGEAIVIGMITELYISHKKLNFPMKDLMVIKDHLDKYFDLISFSDCDIDQIYELLIYDKKNSSNKINFVLLKGIGEPILDQSVNSDIFKESFLFYNNLL